MSLLVQSEKGSLVRWIKVFQILFYPKNNCAILPINNFTIILSFVLSWWQACMFIDIYTYFSKHIVHYVFQILVSDRRRCTSDFNSISTWVLSIYPVLSSSMKYPPHKFCINILYDYPICFQFLKLSEDIYTSVVRFVICKAQFAENSLIIEY